MTASINKISLTETAQKKRLTEKSKGSRPGRFRAASPFMYLFFLFPPRGSGMG